MRGRTAGRAAPLLRAAALLLPLAGAACAPGGSGPTAATGAAAAPAMAAAVRAGIGPFDLRSTAHGRDYRIFLAVPEAPPPAQGYPVVYLLDGNATFPLMREAQARDPAAGPLVVVGIGYPVEGRFDVARRYEDLTPPTPAHRIPTRDGSVPLTGGRDTFLAFIERELRPEIERRVPIDRARQTLFGHSLAGHFALHVLFTRPEMFQAYVAADPSIWWNGRSILAAQAAFVARRGEAAQPARLLIETAGRRPVRPGLAEADAARLARLRSGPGGETVAAALAAVPGLHVAHRRFDDETHGSMLPLAVADALAFAVGRAPD